ncbi:MAG: ATP-binding protein [Chloroflexi bacterium]|nr:ATP-binding protein [Chloroflexota bacterium]
MRFVIPVTNGVSGRAVPCRCYEAVLAAQREQSLLRNGRLPPGLQQMTFQTFVAASRKQSVAQAQCREFARNPQGWLLLAGKSGSGKTHLAAAVANARLAQQQPVNFTNTADLLDVIRSAYDSHTYDETFRAICEAPLLILEDLGHENRTPWSREKLYQLLSYRALHQLALMATTSYEVARLDGRIAGQILNNLDCEILNL